MSIGSRIRAGGLTASLGNRVSGFLQSVETSGVRFDGSPRLLGRFTAGAGAGEEVILGDGLSFTGNTLNVAAGASIAVADGTGSFDFDGTTYYFPVSATPP